jgi:hypothetical protein
MPDGANQSDDLSRPAIQQEPPAKRILTGERLACHRFVDDDHRRGRRTIELGEFPAPQERNLHRAEIVGHDDPEVGLGLLAGARTWPALDDDGQIEVNADRIQRERRHRTC